MRYENEFENDNVLNLFVKLMHNYVVNSSTYFSLNLINQYNYLNYLIRIIFYVNIKSQKRSLK